MRPGRKSTFSYMALLRYWIKIEYEFALSVLDLQLIGLAIDELLL